MSEQVSRFAAVELTPGRAEAVNDLRAGAAVLERMMLELCGDSRERSLALTNLEQAIMWANKAISRYGVPQ